MTTLAFHPNWVPEIVLKVPGCGEKSLYPLTRFVASSESGFENVRCEVSERLDREGKKPLHTVRVQFWKERRRGDLTQEGSELRVG